MGPASQAVACSAIQQADPFLDVDVHALGRVPQIAGVEEIDPQSLHIFRTNRIGEDGGEVFLAKVRGLEPRGIVQRFVH
ncbi:MAG: hypothetical protein ACK56I_15540 [bacterium]